MISGNGGGTVRPRVEGHHGDPWVVHLARMADLRRLSTGVCRRRSRGTNRDMLTILLIILVLFLLFGGGGYAYRGRRRRL